MTTDKIYQGVGDVSADLAALREDIAKLTGAVGDLVRGQASSAAGTVAGAVDQARQSVTETAGDVQARMSSSARDIEGMIERNPMTAIMVALVGGLIIGLFTRTTK